MTDPRRLVEDGGSGTGAALLRAALDEPLPARVMKKTIVAVGAGTAIAATSGAAAAAASSASASAATKATAGIGVAWAVKWVGIGVLAGTVTVGTTVQVQGVLSHPAAAPAVSASSQRLALRTSTVWGGPGVSSAAMANPEPSTVQPTASATSEVLPRLAPGPLPAQWNSEWDDEPTSMNPPILNVPSASAAPPVASGGNAPAALLAAEVDLLDQARTALAGGREDMALALLDRHARQFPGGRLTPEAFLVRIEALVQLGRLAAARQLAADYLARNPGGSDAAYIRRLLGDDAL